ncbi:NAD(P)H-dependent oxidoreductase [uncultured Prevotella sp.]|uniref:NAD(P)H-dependent oxidoreductase n=1 Tax=uncultured Prevotella sp. TaxID=159272 RepID=UPI0025F778D9|nr:NAD(P)H-dependent oxidoreductase [uncultured Prevotella sp.]
MKLIMSDKPLNINIQNGNDTKYFDLSSLKIANCMGCFRCWTKTPGKCVIRDDATAVYPCIAKSNKVIYVSRLKYGGYDSVMKTMLERAIPIQQAFIRIHNDETHHVQRAVTPKQATIIAYGEIDEEERDIFRNLIARNASNMSFESYNIIFTTEAMLDDMVNKVLETWDE